MTDLMFSCRIQAKRVEHAFVSYILRRYRERKSTDFYVNYRKTSKNAVPGKVFDDFGFEAIGVRDGVTELRYPATKEIPDDHIVEIVSATPQSTMAGAL